MHAIIMDSPLGPLQLVSEGEHLVAINFPDHHSSEAESSPPTPVLKAAKKQLQEYFAGRRQDFNLPLAATGTPFQHSVWEALRQIPFGEVRSYRDIALAINKPKAVRAVGGANGRNPLPIVVPCHRVIGAHGALTGFAGGLPLKRQLLAIEGGCC
ncbi:MAG TPA: methylated-DNA--[protein]-cysteine S-methyltransferase [Kineobactrum sp.]